jgi:hypothetical protein
VPRGLGLVPRISTKHAEARPPAPVACFDFSDRPKLVKHLRVYSAQSGRSQKDVMAEALEAYFAHHADGALIARLAESSFSEWDNDEDENL